MKHPTMKELLERNEWGWIIIEWLENGYLNRVRFDDYKEAREFLQDLRKRGLK